MVYCLSTTPWPIPRFLAHLSSFFSQSETSILTLCSRWQYFWLDDHYMAASTLKHICECFYWRPSGIIKYLMPIHTQRCVITSLANWTAWENADSCISCTHVKITLFFPPKSLIWTLFACHIFVRNKDLFYEKYALVWMQSMMYSWIMVYLGCFCFSWTATWEYVYAYRPYVGCIFHVEF